MEFKYLNDRKHFIHYSALDFLLCLYIFMPSFYKVWVCCSNYLLVDHRQKHYNLIDGF